MADMELGEFRLFRALSSPRSSYLPRTASDDSNIEIEMLLFNVSHELKKKDIAIGVCVFVH